MKNILIDPSQERHILDLRLLKFQDVQVLGRYVYTKARAPLKTHDHGSMMEICYLVDGQQLYQIGHDEYFLNGGDILINYPYERHGTGSQREGRGTLYWMIIRPPSVRSSFLGLLPREGKLLWNILLQLPSRHFRAKPEIRKYLDKIFMLLENKLPFDAQVNEFDEECQAELSEGNIPGVSNDSDDFLIMNVRNYLLRFLIDLIEIAKSENVTSVSPEIRHVIELIKERDDAFYTMKSLARQAGLSESRFKHRFKDEVGTSPANYQLQRKIDKACSLLEQEESIINISNFLGFSSSQYFATVFRRYMGISPFEYRTLFADTEKNRANPSGK